MLKPRVSQTLTLTHLPSPLKSSAVEVPDVKGSVGVGTRGADDREHEQHVELRRRLERDGAGVLVEVLAGRHRVLGWHVGR